MKRFTFPKGIDKVNIPVLMPIGQVDIYQFARRKIAEAQEHHGRSKVAQWRFRFEVRGDYNSAEVYAYK